MALTRLLAVVTLAQLWLASAEVNVNVTATGDVESDWTVAYYAKEPLLLGNDGGPDKGGLHVYSLDASLPEVTSLVIGRTKLVITVYSVGGRDYAVTIAAPDSIIRVYEVPSFSLESEFKLLGDWSALCPWRSKAGNQYFFLFGKRQAVQFLIRDRDGVELAEVRA